jgi:hypothetical protein
VRESGWQSPLILRGKTIRDIFHKWNIALGTFHQMKKRVLFERYDRILTNSSSMNQYSSTIGYASNPLLIQYKKRFLEKLQ